MRKFFYFIPLLFVVFVVYLLHAFGFLNFNKIIFYYPCELPIRYSLDTIDSRFGLSREQTLTATKEAAALWNTMDGKELFTYDPEGNLSINLLFDSRQQLTNEYTDLQNKIKQKENELNPKIAEYEMRSTLFKNRVTQLNDKIASWNEKREISPEEYDLFIQEEKSLKEEADSLNMLGESLGLETDAFNGQVAELNQTVDQLDEALAEKPEEGVYIESQNRIEVYFNNNRQELIRTIAHELGHARGLDHVTNSKAIMYPTATSSFNPTIEDVTGLKNVCQKQNNFLLLQRNLQLRLEALLVKRETQ